MQSYLMRSAWVIESYVRIEDGDTTDDYQFTDDCELDDSLVFLSSHIIAKKFGDVHCNSGPDDSTDIMEWSLSGDEKVLILDGDPYTLLKHSDNEMVCRFENTDEGYIEIITFIRGKARRGVAEMALIMSAPWTIQSIIEISNGTTSDLFSDMADCDKDNEYHFLSNNVVEIHGGKTKCSPNETNPTDVGEWGYSYTIQKIYFGLFNFDIIELTDHKIVMLAAQPSDNYWLTYILVR
ncbi:MAG: hypothetical protein GC180_07525 [Bacteroidetes bacterium]|nr:hypothetical protein [Bacteroidota bacterium]